MERKATDSRSLALPGGWFGVNMTAGQKFEEALLHVPFALACGGVTYRDTKIIGNLLSYAKVLS